ncbi:sugar transporter [Rhodobacter xanthinilyticus]|uniref:sugar transporter n=1 Tax=Rhodobacter xanthinilyticus TaxID=1850250 RepID=UPI000A7AFF51|nr:sugar transporter [Rhodobacter xanthinilyticus]
MTDPAEAPASHPTRLAAAAAKKLKLKVRPPAQFARLQRRHKLLAASFAAVVVAPVLLAGLYLYAIANDQFASRVGFSVRREEAGSAVEMLGGIAQLSGSSSSDTDILYEYIRSEAMVRAINARIDLMTVFANPGDPVFSIGSDARIEQMLAFWKRMVDVFYDSSAGLIEIRVLAFDPEDAQQIATAIADESSKMINQLSAIAREDATRYAREDLDQAVASLKEARSAITQFRVRSQIVDPQANVQGRMGILNNLQERLASAMIELDMLAKDDPRRGELQQRIDVIRGRIADERSEFGRAEQENPDNLANLINEYESLTVDQAFAEKRYLTALATYDAAVAEAQRKSRYLAIHIPPTRAETSEYPRRFVILSALAGLLFVAWSIMAMIYYSLRDRR